MFSQIYTNKGVVQEPRPVNNNQSSSKEQSSEDSSGSERAEAELHGADSSRVLPYLSERIQFKIPSDLAYLDEVLEYLNNRLSALGIVPPDDHDVLIALDEAIVNAIRHGNKNDPHKMVRITAQISSRGARFTIRDEGPGFSREGVPDPTDPLRLLVPSGRGLLLIKHIMDKVYHNETGNQICMVRRAHKHVPKHGKANGRKKAK
ncbi:MAG: ATP-binding protein [Blastocatellia bacterium]